MFVLALIVAAAGVMLGAWWAPFLVGIAVGTVERRGRLAVPLGAVTGLVAWTFPLAQLDISYGVGPAASSLAAIMGFGHQSAIPLALTCVVGLLLGLTGAWLGSAARSLLSSNVLVDAERTE